MANNRRKYFRRTRKTRMRDLKQSPAGILSFCAAAAACAAFCAAVILSFRANGQAEVFVGGIGLVGLVLSAGAFACGILAVKEPKIRPLAPRCGLTMGAVMTAVFVCMYAYGFR